VKTSKFKKIIDSFYENYLTFVVVAFILQNFVIFITILKSYPQGEILITTNTKNELKLELIWFGILIISSIFFAIIYFSQFFGQDTDASMQVKKKYTNLFFKAIQSHNADQLTQPSKRQAIISNPARTQSIQPSNEPQVITAQSSRTNFFPSTMENYKVLTQIEDIDDGKVRKPNKSVLFLPFTIDRFSKD
jgi:hypothetical protein